MNLWNEYLVKMAVSHLAYLVNHLEQYQLIQVLITLFAYSVLNVDFYVDNVNLCQSCLKKQCLYLICIQ